MRKTCTRLCATKTCKTKKGKNEKKSLFFFFTYQFLQSDVKKCYKYLIFKNYQWWKFFFRISFYVCFFFLLENSLHMQKEQRQWMAGPSHKISLEIRGNQSIARTQIGDLHSNCVNIDRAFIFFADLSKMFMYRIPNKNGKKGILYCFLFLKKSKLSQRIMRHAPIFKLVFFF